MNPPTPTWPHGHQGQQQPIHETFVDQIRVDGVAYDEASGCETVFTLPDGSEHALKTRASFVILGDGTVLGGRHGPRLDRIAVCSECLRLHQPLLENGSLTWAQAVIKSSVLRERILFSQSGAPLCPRHATIVETPEGRRIMAPKEAQDFEDQELIKAPFRFLAKLLRE